MKNNIYIFSNSILGKKDNSLILETMTNTKPIHEIDLFENEYEGVILPPPKTEGNGNTKRIPAETVEAIYTFGEVRFNTQFFKCVSYYEIPVHMFNYYGNYIGSFIPVSKNGSGEIQIVQYCAYLNDAKRLFIAKAIITSAMKNMLANLKSYIYSGIDLDEPVNSISVILEKVRLASSIQELMGFEGIAKNIYYDCWNDIFKQETDFEKRIKNPPTDFINSLISFGNSMLYAVCLSEIFRTRLNPFVGFLHETGNNKHPLVYDISEIFKPVIVDKVIFRIINLNMIKADDFKISDKGLRLKDDAKRKFVEEFENKLSSVIHHKRLNRRISFRSLIRMECYNLINYLTGKVKTYDPYRAN